MAMSFTYLRIRRMSRPPTTSLDTKASRSPHVRSILPRRMVRALHSNDLELSDLAEDKPLLLDAETGESDGISLLNWLGSGGMSAVFLAERTADEHAPRLTD